MDGQTDMAKLILAFRRFANAPKKEKRKPLVLSGLCPGETDYVQ